MAARREGKAVADRLAGRRGAGRKARVHRLAGTTVDGDMAYPDRIEETCLQRHRQHRSTWALEVMLQPWSEKW